MAPMTRLTVLGTGRLLARVRTLSEEIARMRIRLSAVLTQLERRRHNATDVQHLAWAHAGAGAAGALVLAAIVAMPVLTVRPRRQRRWAHPGVTLTDRARRLGRALGRVAHDPDRLAAQPPPSMLGIPLKTLAALVLTAAQILAEMRERRRRNEAAALRDGMHPGRATGVASAPAPMGQGFHRGLHRSHEAQGSAFSNQRATLTLSIREHEKERSSTRGAAANPFVPYRRDK